MYNRMSALQHIPSLCAAHRQISATRAAGDIRKFSVSFAWVKTVYSLKVSAGKGRAAQKYQERRFCPGCINRRI